jgi:hypothetical protein
MSGIIGNNTVRVSGVIAATAAGLNWDSAVITGSTLSASANAGYFINTTSNICTITLPSSAEVGDQIVFADYARTWGTNKIVIDSNGLNYQGDPDTFVVEYSTAGETVAIVYSGATKGWIPMDDDEVADAVTPPAGERAMFVYGSVAVFNILSNLGVFAADVTAAGTNRTRSGAANYGVDKGIVAFGSGPTNVSNLITSAGVIGSDVTGVGTARNMPAACGYGSDLAFFANGRTSYPNTTSAQNKVSNSGVVASDNSSSGQSSEGSAACRYGTQTAIISYGSNPPGSYLTYTNKVSSTGVIASNTSGAGTARSLPGAASFGGDKGIFCCGYGGSQTNMTNIVSNSGVVASDVTVSGVSVREGPGASGYGGDKACFAYGEGTPSNTNVKNLISSSGVVSADAAGVGSARAGLIAAEF